MIHLQHEKESEDNVSCLRDLSSVLREGLKLRDLQDCMDDLIEKLDKSKSEGWIEIWLVVLPLESCLIFVIAYFFHQFMVSLHKTS